MGNSKEEAIKKVKELMEDKSVVSFEFFYSKGTWHIEATYSSYLVDTPSISQGWESQRERLYKD